MQGDPGDEDVIPIRDPAVVDLDWMKRFTGAKCEPRVTSPFESSRAPWRTDSRLQLGRTKPVRL
jgi:hypothetical protein